MIRWGDMDLWTDTPITAVWSSRHAGKELERLSQDMLLYMRVSNISESSSRARGT